MPDLPATWMRLSTYERDLLLATKINEPVGVTARH
jgi:hypothetical protein